MPTESYKARTRQNVHDSDATIWFGSLDSAGAIATLGACQAMSKPAVWVVPDEDELPSQIAAWLAEKPYVKVLNVAGKRESVNPGIGQRVARFLAAVLRRLGHERIG